MKHTKSPWIYENRNGDHPGNTCKGWGTVGLWGADNSLIFGSGQGWDGGFSEPSDEDQRLIEAAPNLLMLLKELIDIEGPQPGNVTWFKKVKSAIEKAEGKS